MLNPQQRKALLRVAREAVEAAAKNMPYTPASDDPDLLRPAAAFVTLRKRGELRGCIGMIEAKEPLITTVAGMARASAVEDYRFPPVQMIELPGLTIEISLLTPCERVTDVNEIEVGKHGLIMQLGSRRGLLLPQVPVEWGWTREQFLEHCCIKAGLPKDAWRKGAEMLRFTAEVFAERD